ncbi:MAG: V-type ATP synthase subunit F [Candidatus Bathyarchaeota archaeon]|nr:V-type ATP synthase subunit F [Candidatus Bathyarchaeota archaeon]
MSIAVIGPSSFVTCFELIGATGYEEHDEGALVATLDRIVSQGDYKLVVIPERYAAATRHIREEVMKRGRITPIFALIPGLTMETGMRMEELQAVVSLAIGTKLEL